MVINWESVKAYEIQPFESLSGSGFTLKIYQKNHIIVRISFIGINLLDNYNIIDSDSLIFNLIQQINEYNQSHELNAKHITQKLTNSNWKYLSWFFFFFGFLFLGCFFKIINQHITVAYWVFITISAIIGFNFYFQHRFETVINSKLSGLHSNIKLHNGSDNQIYE
jgi:hypothetical protein